MAANLISSARPSVLHRAALGVGRVFRLQKHQLLVSSNHPCLWISRDKLWECRSGCAHSSRTQRGSPPPLLSSLHSGHETTAVQQHLTFPTTVFSDGRGYFCSLPKTFVGALFFCRFTACVIGLLCVRIQVRRDSR